MAHRGLMREAFGLLCMAVLVHKSEKKTVPQPTTVFIETVPTVDDYFSIPIVTFVPPTSPPPPTGYLPSVLSFFILALSVIGNEVLNAFLQLALRNVLLPLLRIAKRWSVASIKSAWRRVHGWTSRGRVTGADASSNINESSRSESSQAPTAAPEDVGNNKKIDELSRSAPSQVATPVPKDPNSETNAQDLAIENTKLSTENKRLERQVLSLEMEQQSSVQDAVQKARDDEREAAKQREQSSIQNEVQKVLDNERAEAKQQEKRNVQHTEQKTKQLQI